MGLPVVVSPCATLPHVFRAPLFVLLLSLTACVRPVVHPALPDAGPDDAPDANDIDAGGLAGPTTLRRLTNAQYVNAVADLLGDTQLTVADLPSEAVVGGFNNAAEAQAPADLRIARTQRIAQQLAERLTDTDEHLSRWSGCQRFRTLNEQRTCVETLITGTARRFFRRPLTDDEASRLRSRFSQWQAQSDFTGACQLLLEWLLQCPQFVYRPETESTFDGYARATRLALLVWNSVPDDALLTAAANHELDTREGLVRHAQSMMRDRRFQRTLLDFHRQWLNLDRLLLDEHDHRTADIDPGWSAATQRAALAESERFLTYALFDDATLTTLLTSRRAWLDAETAPRYGVSLDRSPEVLLPEGQRAGILTRLAFLASSSHPGTTSPPIRGNLVNLRLLCRQPNPPPPELDTSLPRPDGGPQTTRQLFEARTAGRVCAGCHRSLNGFGFGFEHYSASGQWRTDEHGLPIDATGSLWGTDLDGPFTGALELSTRLSQSRDVHLCATQLWVRYALGRAPTAEEQPFIDSLAQTFIDHHGDARALLSALVESPLVFDFTPELTE